MPVLSLAKIIARPGPVNNLRIMMHGMGSIRQASKMPGCIEAIAASGGKGNLFAVSLWDDADALKAYVHSGAHGAAAKKVKDLARCHVAGHLPWEQDRIPEWTQWGALLAEHGHARDTAHVGDLTQADKLAGPAKRDRFPLRARRKVAAPKT